MPLLVFRVAVTRSCARCRTTPRPTPALFSTSAPSAVSAPPGRPTPGRRRTPVRRSRAPLQPRWISGTAARPSDSQGADSPAGAASASSEEAAAAAAARGAPATFYDLFPQSLPDGPPPASPFAIDVRALRREFLQLQGRAHPDLHPSDRKTHAQSASAHLNEAFRTLADPLLRAQYLLSLRGIDVAGDEAGKVADMELLGDVMEAREDIEEALREEELDGPRRVNDGRIEETVAALERAFAEEDMEEATREAVRLRYWVNIKQCLDDWEPGKPIELPH